MQREKSNEEKLKCNGKKGDIMPGYISLKDVVKTYKVGDNSINACDGVSLDIDKGQFVIIVGPSGAGKTTVLNILGGMDTLTSGSVVVDNTDISKLRPKALISYRREDVGFVFQFYNLMANLTALENVELALQICKEPMDAKTVLEEVGLVHRMNNFPAELSDEPTGALDYVTGKEILKLLQDMCRERGMTVVVITHNTALTPMADKVIHIKNGKVSSAEINENSMSVSDIEW